MHAPTTEYTEISIMAELALCRTCARPADRLQPLFTHPDKYKRYALALKLSTGLQIEMNDGLPQHICTECSQEISRILKFRTNSQKAQTRLFELGYRKNNIHENELASTTIKKKFHQNLDSDESLDESDHDDDDFSSFAEVEILGSVAKHNFSDSKKIKLDGRQSNKAQMVKAKLLKSQLRLDKYLDTSAPLYTCKECKKNYKIKTSFVAHTFTHTALKYTCDSCGKGLFSRQRLLRHQRAIHGAARDISLRCPHCEYHALDKENLKVHIHTHTGERPFICDVCGVGFTARALLNQHHSVHVTEKNVQCKECPAKFKSRHDLNVHRSRSHKPRRWSYKCTYCPNLYVKSTDCRKHMRLSHGIPNEQQEKSIRVPFKLEPNVEQVMS